MIITPKEIVDFSVDYICRLFEANGDKRGVLHTRTPWDNEKDKEKNNGLLEKLSQLKEHIKKGGKPALMDGAEILIDHFNPSLDENNGEDSYCLSRLFLPTYWIFLKDYACRDEGFPNGGGNPRSKEHYWHLRNGIPNRDEFKNKVLRRYESYLAANLEILQSSS